MVVINSQPCHLLADGAFPVLLFQQDGVVARTQAVQDFATSFLRRKRIPSTPFGVVLTAILAPFRIGVPAQPPTGVDFLAIPVVPVTLCSAYLFSLTSTARLTRYLVLVALDVATFRSQVAFGIVDRPLTGMFYAARFATVFIPVSGLLVSIELSERLFLLAVSTKLTVHTLIVT